MDDAPIIGAFKHMQVPLMIVGPDGSILNCNDAAGRLFDISRDDLMRMAVTDILSIASVEELNAHIEPPAIDATIKDILGRRSDGMLMPLGIQMTAWSDEKQGLQHALVLRDITDDIEAARAAKEALMRANSAITGARIGVFEYDRDARKVFVSGIWRELLGLANEDAEEVEARWRERVHPDDLEAAMAPIQHCIDGLSERASCEYRLRPKDGGDTRWLRTEVAVSKRDKSGRVTHLIGVMTDITERKETENALRTSMDQFRSAFENTTIGKAVVGRDGRFHRVNHALCEFLGYSEDRLLEMDVAAISHPDDLPNNVQWLEPCATGPSGVHQAENRYVRATGEIVWGMLSVGLVRDADGEPSHFIAQIVDVTEQRRLSELKSEFVATVSHELRTPLTSVLGSISLLSSMDAEPFSDQAQRLLFIAQENGKRLQALIKDILDFEKFSAKQMPLNPSRQRIAKLMDSALMANLATADKYKVRFDFQTSDRDLQGYVDPQRFQQVMTNLLTNAAKFAYADTKVRVDLRADGPDVRVCVTNAGDGIPDEFRSQLFKPFSQAAPSATRARDGTGLGLNITRQIIEKSGGSIGFDSEPGGETTFWFTLPGKKPKLAS